MKTLIAIFLIAACALAVRAQGQSQAQTTTQPCPKAAAVTPKALLGLWRAEFEGQAAGATLLLEPHAQHAQSLAGNINRNGERWAVAADLEDGEFSLEESADGRSISATWIGDVVEGSCGREIRGTRKGPWDAAAQPFILRRLESR